MERASAEALKWIRDFEALADRLAGSDIVVTSLRCQWGGGFWAIEAQQGAATEKYREGLRGPNPLLAVGPEVVKCVWDHRDRVLACGSSPTTPLCAPNQWKEEASVAADSHDKAIAEAEKFILKRCGQS